MSILIRVKFGLACWQGTFKLVMLYSVSKIWYTFWHDRKTQDCVKETTIEWHAILPIIFYIFIFSPSKITMRKDNLRCMPTNNWHYSVYAFNNWKHVLQIFDMQPLIYFTLLDLACIDTIFQIRFQTKVANLFTRVYLHICMHNSEKQNQNSMQLKIRLCNYIPVFLKEWELVRIWSS